MLLLLSDAQSVIQIIRTSSIADVCNVPCRSSRHLGYVSTPHNANLLQTSYGEAGVMDVDLYGRQYAVYLTAWSYSHRLTVSHVVEDVARLHATSMRDDELCV